MHIEGHADLPEVVPRRTSSGSFTGGIDAGNQQSEQRGDDHHHDEKLDQRKRPTDTHCSGHGESLAQKTKNKTAVMRLSLNSDEGSLASGKSVCNRPFQAA
jgi:hypothetical protein